MKKLANGDNCRAVIWCAVSTKQQTSEEKDSLPRQEKDALAICQREGWRVVDVLRVPGFSRDYIDIYQCAEDMARQGIYAFDRLLELFKSNGFDVLICRDGDRFARTQTIHSFIVETIIRSMGARIFVTRTQTWVDSSNFRMFISMDGFKSASEIDALKARRKIGIRKRAERGLNTSWAPTGSHVVIRDERGKADHLELDPSKARLWDDLATLILEGIGWDLMEAELYSRYGHVHPETGRPYAPRTMYQYVYKPNFWGHTGQYFYGLVGAWIHEDDIDPPEGVELYRHTIPAVYTGDLAQAVRAELLRRESIVKGRARPHSAYRFTGILLCSECDRRYVVIPYRSGRVGWRCGQQSTSYGRAQCSQHKVLPDEAVQEYLTKFLGRVLEPGGLSLIEAGATPTDYRVKLQEEIREVTAQIENMIGLQAGAKTEAVREAYTRKIEEAGDRLEILEARYRELGRSVEPMTVTRARASAVEEIRRLTVSGLWELPANRVNQLLLNVFGRSRLAVKDGRIIEIIKP